jgi:OmpA family protein/PEGA domain-containing protein
MVQQQYANSKVRKENRVMNVKSPLGSLLSAAAFLALGTVSAIAQSGQATGKLKIHVSPKQAYVFVDGKAIRDGSQTIELTPGSHAVGVDNYGYVPQTKNVDITAGKTTDTEVTLQASGDKVSGPFGDIELKGHPRAAVLLNGTTPAYFVGHVDEFDNNWVWHQWLLVKPGTYQVTAMEKGQTVWSGPVEVKAGQRVIVDLNHNGVLKTKDFKRGLNMGPQPRFEAGVASAMVPVAPVAASLSAQSNQVNCGQSTELSWKSSDAADTSISNIGSVAASGDQAVKPMHPTTYQLVAKGPGGTAEQSVTVNVNGTPTATLALSQPEIRYHKIGDKVVQQDSTTLNWSASDADHVTLQPFGNVTESGSRSVEAAPDRSGDGPVHRDITYTLSATNACGGTATRTATLHVVGSIDPAPPVTLASLFYPTAYPERRHPKLGLVSSQEKTLAAAATTFKNNEQYDEQNKLTVVGHADVRGPKKYNEALSMRRAEVVKNYLVSQGIPADKIETRAEGKEHELTEQDVTSLQAQDPQPQPAWMKNKKKATWLAYNRRVDVILEPKGQQSTEAYPNEAPDARILWQRPVPKLKTVETASQVVPGNENAQLSSAHN